MGAVQLAAVKAYMKVSYDDDDGLISALIEASEEYLKGAGARQEVAPASYELIVKDMVLRQYDGRDSDVEHAVASPLVGRMLQQLKLRSAYGSEGTT